MESTDIFQLAEGCQINLHAACKRAGIAYSTPYRWRTGSTNRSQDTVDRLRAAILLLARERGTLPPELHAEADKVILQPGPAGRDARAIMRDIKANIKELDRALTA